MSTMTATPNSDEAQQVADLVSLVESLREEYIELVGNLAVHVPEESRADLGQHVAKVATGVQDRVAEIVGNRAGRQHSMSDNDRLRALADLAASPLGDEIDNALAWARTRHNGGDFEIFLHPEDAGPLVGGAYQGCPIHQSIGVPRGKVLIFDRATGRYIRNGER
jgi:hypothetical protein